MTEQERAAALADKIELRGCVDLTSKWDWGQTNADSIELIVSALRAYARPAPADLREAIAKVIGDLGWYPADSLEPERIADAVLSLLPQMQAASDAVRDVIAERRRQVEAEGWTPEHDDEHDRGEIADAAACYAMTPMAFHRRVRTEHPAGERVGIALWPWSRAWWKPGERRRDLIKAGALIIAEIERLDRAKEG